MKNTSRRCFWGCPGRIDYENVFKTFKYRNVHNELQLFSSDLRVRSRERPRTKSNNLKASNRKTKQCKFLSPPPLIKSVEYPKSSFCNRLALAHSKIELHGVILTVIISTKYICTIIYQNDINLFKEKV